MRWTCCLLLAVLCACGPTSPADAGRGDAGECEFGRLEVGRGGSRAVPLRPGDTLPIVVGAQGGIHVVVAAWVEDVELDLTLRYRLVDAEGSRVGEPTEVELRPALFRPDGPRFLRHPDLVVLDNDTPRVADFDGRAVTLEARVVSTDGSVLCDARAVTLAAE